MYEDAPVPRPRAEILILTSQEVQAMDDAYGEGNWDAETFENSLKLNKG